MHLMPCVSPLSIDWRIHNFQEGMLRQSHVEHQPLHCHCQILTGAHGHLQWTFFTSEFLEAFAAQRRMACGMTTLCKGDLNIMIPPSSNKSSTGFNWSQPPMTMVFDSSEWLCQCSYTSDYHMEEKIEHCFSNPHPILCNFPAFV